jgi:hypothetical protein
LNLLSPRFNMNFRRRNSLVKIAEDVKRHINLITWCGVVCACLREGRQSKVFFDQSINPNLLYQLTPLSTYFSYTLDPLIQIVTERTFWTTDKFPRASETDVLVLFRFVFENHLYLLNCTQ